MEGRFNPLSPVCACADACDDVTARGGGGNLRKLGENILVDRELSEGMWKEKCIISWLCGCLCRRMKRRRETLGDGGGR